MKKISEQRKKWVERTIANKRTYKLYLYNRFFVFLLLGIAQLLGYVCLLYLFADNARVGVAVQFAISVLSLFVVLVLINKNERPSVKLSWILLILLLPIVGVPSYIIYGEGKPTRKMNKKIERSKAENDETFRSVYGETELISPENRGEGVCRYLTEYGKFPLYRTGALTYYKSGEEVFPAILEALQSAKEFILLDYFIIESGKFWNSILKILLEKATVGVRVRIIYDNFGCLTTLPPDYDKYLEGLHENIRCMTFNKLLPIFSLRMNNRNHRKILVIDGKISFTGGINLADEYIGEKKKYGYWKDSALRMQGDAVNVFTKMFFDMWNAFRIDKEELKNYLKPLKDRGRYALNDEKALYLQPYDDSPLDGISVGETVYLDIINRARGYVYIFTPYLILDDSMRMALRLAATRGVDVRIVTPGVPDKRTTYRLTRANYAELMRAGVKIYEYTPGFIHAKSIVCDDECAVVGTINFDYRSLYHHFENAVYFANCEEVFALKRDCEETFAISKLCENGYPKRTVFGRFFDAVLRVFETLF